MIRLFCVLLFQCLLGWIFCTPVNSQDTTDYFQSGYLRFENYIYRENIRTVILEQEGVRLSEPVIELGSSERLLFSFDDLNADYRNYSYTLIHCNAGWTPSSLLPNEYLSGFTEDRITDYRLSFNTIQPYMHYTVSIPGREVIPVLTGNYLLKVYPEGSPDSVIITRRLLVVQQRVTVEATVQQATIVQNRNSKQEIDFSINHNGLQVSNPFDDVKVVIMQNGRWDNAITGLKPLFIKDNLLEYNYDEENTFNGGNEFRTFDTRSLRTQTQFVEKILQGNDGYTVVITTDKSRSFDRYVSEYDINGKYLIRTTDGRDNDLEGEYVKVKFTLRHDILANGNFYVFGALTDWRVGNENKMTYNYDEGTYEALLFLKQGYYDYEYVFLEDGASHPDETIVEGNHFETGNEYAILVYYRGIGTRYDQLVGISRMRTR
jgi:hypothetical protein